MKFSEKYLSYIFPAVFVINALIILFIWWQGSGLYITQPWEGSYYIAFGRLTGLFAEYFLLTELLLVGRVWWLEKFFGFVSMSRLHHAIGTWLIFLILSHPLLLTLGYARQNSTGLTEQFTSLLFNWEDVFKALIGVILIFAAVGTSIKLVRMKIKYERWYFVHLTMYLAIGLAFGHQINSGDVSEGSATYYWLALNYAVFGLILLYRFLRPLYLFYKYKFTIDKIEKETDDVYSVYISGRHMREFSFESGQFANLIFLAKGMRQSHPFSFSAAPNGKNLRFSIKKLGDFTNKIDELKKGTRVILDGPYGRFTLAHALTKKCLLIAGGIGITPIRAMAEDCAKHGVDAVVMYSAKNSASLTFKKELDELAAQFKKLQVVYIVDEKTERFECGMINEEKITRLVPDYSERDIYICGPGPMMQALINILESKGLPKSRLHHEMFSF